MAAAIIAKRDRKYNELDSLFFTFETSRRGDPERLHLAIQVAALDAQHVGGARHVPLLLGPRSETQTPLEAVARLVKRQAIGRLDRLGTGRRPHVQKTEIGRRNRVARN